ncbi:hypothetical protein ACSQ67_023540 [Phaseolus vulgaris]
MTLRNHHLREEFLSLVVPSNSMSECGTHNFKVKSPMVNTTSKRNCQHGPDVPSFHKNALFPNKAKEKLMSLEKDRLVQETVGQPGHALAASCLVITMLKDWRGSTDKKSHEVAKLHQ